MPLTPSVTPGDFFIEVARGLVPEERLFQRFGVNPDIRAAEETVWCSGGLFVRPTTAQTVTVVSTSALDTSAGSGAREVAIIGVDAAYNEVVDVAFLNGTTPAAGLLGVLFKEINQFVVLTSGTPGQNNVGDITVTRSGDAQVLCHMRAGKGISESAMVTVPTGRRAYVDNIRLAAQGQGVAEFTIWSAGSSGADPTPPLAVHSVRIQNTDAVEVNLQHAPLLVPSGAMLFVTAKNAINNTPMWVSAFLSMNTAPNSRFLNYSTQV